MKSARRVAPFAWLSGIAAGAVTLGVAELAAAVVDRTVGSDATPSPLLAVGSTFVDLTPAWLKDFAIATFGTNDKLVLFIGMGLTLTLVCAALGVVAARLRPLGLAGFGLVGVVGLGAVLTRPDAAWTDAIPTFIGVAAGMTVLSWLLTRPSAAEPTMQPSRRAVLAWGGGIAAVGLVGIAFGRMLNSAGEAVAKARATLSVPKVATPVQVPDGATTDVPGQTSFISPNDNFYRIDTALSVPQVDPEQWSLKVTGMVDQEIEMSLDDLLQEEMVEALVTLTCVSNQVGGDLAGNAVWTGWPVRHLLERAGVQDGADMVLSTSDDGFTAGTPLEALTDDRDSLLAVGMNGELLPAQHGFPVRMVVPGLYGYVSATKWLTELKVTRFDADQGYWTPRGWSARGPIKTASRIDVPRSGASVDAGAVMVAGVAWAQQRGVERVEVRVDDGDWAEASLAEEASIDAWRMWTWEWDASSGDHTLQVRATDGDGNTQTQETAPPAPDGASGWHSVDVSVG